jgi:hypothetical protein
MEKLTKNEAKNKFGKTSLFSGSTGLAKLTYIAGIENFDPTEIEGLESLSLADKQMFFKEPFVKIKPTKNDAIIFEINSVPLVFTGFFNNDLAEVVYQAANDVVESKDKSVIGRAIVGGILLGPLGAIIGGASGIGEKVKTLMHGKSLIYFNSANETLLILGSDNKLKKETITYLKNTFSNKLKIDLK